MEIMGFVLWEGVTLLFVILSGLAFLTIRRKTSGRPLFTNQDWHTYFGDLQLQVSKPRLVVMVCRAVFLCFLMVLIGSPLLARLGLGLYSVTMIFACLGIVKLTLR